MILQKMRQQLRQDLKTLESVPVEEGAYEMWRRQPLTQQLLGKLEDAYYSDLMDNNIDWRATIEHLLTSTFVNVREAQKNED